MPSEAVLQKIDNETLTEIFNKLKKIYKAESSTEKTRFITNQVEKYGYLPYSYSKALKDLSPAEIITGIEAKLKHNNTYSEGIFSFEEDKVSPVKRYGFINSDWIKKEQHSIKLINLAGLGDGNLTDETGKFIDWLRQLLILPAGNPEYKVLSTTVYLIPFHQRDFGCAYLPISSGVSEKLEDHFIKDTLGLDAKDQIRLFATLSQLAGHPVIYDVLPQSGRFSKVVLANPFVARWFNVNELINALDKELCDIAKKLSEKESPAEIEQARVIISESLRGKYLEIPENIENIAEKIEKELDSARKNLSNQMCLKHNQENLCSKAQEIINRKLNKDAKARITEKDIINHGETIGELIREGFWPAPGGAWCSAGVPVFNKMSNGAGYPLFKHYDYEGNDVSNFANLDCHTPFYFSYLEDGTINEKVVEFYADFLKKFQSDYNFDGFRVDHVDHIADRFSESEDGIPISYRAPRYALGKANRKLKQSCPEFALLAEYMLWDNYYKDYHRDMSFDLLWGDDIIAQSSKTAAKIIENNKELEKYNLNDSIKNDCLSILKAYNNQDGEFREINQYPGQLGEEGALFKWFKLRFLPGGELAQRPVLYVDGDESFTKTGIEKVINSEVSMARENNEEFFKKFDAIYRLSITLPLAMNGKAELYKPAQEFNDFDGAIACWTIEAEGCKEALFIAANQKPPREVLKNNEGKAENVINSPLESVKIPVSEDYKLILEYQIEELDFIENEKINNLAENILSFEKLAPGEFHIYRAEKIS